MSNPGSNGNGNGNAFGRWFGKLLPRKNDNASLRDTLEDLIVENAEADYTIAEHERVLISNVLELRDLRVVDVMVPRADMVAIEINTSFEDVLKILNDKPHTRLPIYRDNLDNLVGALHIKDVLGSIGNDEAFEISRHMREATIVSPAMSVLDLLLQMRQTKVHIAMVIDEYGGIDGLITINDLIEAIVGEIDDEHAYEIQPQIVERGDGTALADARYMLEDFEKEYGHLETDGDVDHDTLGGFVCTLAGRVPARGEIIKHDSGLEFEVLEADPRRITKLRIRNLAPKQEHSLTQ